MKGHDTEGARSEQEAATWVRAMFGRVAHRYDLANHLLSFNIDRLWRARTVRRVRPILERPGARVLDICCGTGDLVMALQRVCARPVFGSDFCHPMLVAARGKVARRHAAFAAVRIRRPAPAGARRFARPDHRGVRLPQPGQL
jgi:demethylmenaquinone methyltransferase/2-methoxy-6-polyprenyl-1,4-benzoquinol methylase